MIIEEGNYYCPLLGENAIATPVRVQWWNPWSIKELRCTACGTKLPHHSHPEHQYRSPLRVVSSR